MLGRGVSIRGDVIRLDKVQSQLKELPGKILIF